MIESKTTKAFNIKRAEGELGFDVTHDVGTDKIRLGGGVLLLSLETAADLVTVLNQILGANTSEPDEAPLKVGQMVRLKAERPGYHGVAGQIGTVVESYPKVFVVQFASDGSRTWREQVSDFEVVE
jgi:uncharacterized protein Veg